MGSLRLAVAWDEAFCFYYNENFRELERAGFELAFFSPLRGQTLPEDAAGLYIGGGYPELHAGTLSGNGKILVDIKQKTDTGMPVVAECGGFMYLTAAIKDEEGAEHSMCGVFDLICVKKDSLVRFGYVEIFDRGGLWLKAEKGIRGHEFHYYDTVKPLSEGKADAGAPVISAGGSAGFPDGERVGNPGAFWDGARIVKASSGREYSGIYVSDSIWAGWPHLYFRSAPGFAGRFFEKCRAYRGVM